MISPQGTPLVLSNYLGGSGDNYSGTCFDMTSATPITSGSAPFSGNFIPQGAGGFDVFNNENPNGTWQLQVYDGAGGDQGSVNSFSINFNPSSGLPVINTQCEVTNLTAPTATDNCGGTVLVSNDVVLPITTQGTTVITWTFEDENGNTSNQTQTVIIDDITAPVPDLMTLPDLISACDITSLTMPTATDNCAGLIEGTTLNVLPITSTSTIVWTYDDGNGNISTQNQQVIINDANPPIPDLPMLADLTAECEITDLVPPTATDDCNGFVTVTNDAILPITAQGTTVVTWTYTDNNLNSSTQTQNVILTDVTDPVITPEEITISVMPGICGAELNFTKTYDIPYEQLLNVWTWGWNCNGTMDVYNGYTSLGVSWNSTSQILPTSLSIEIYQESKEQPSSYDVLFNGFADNAYTGTAGICSNQIVSIELNKDNYILGGLNTLYVNAFDGYLGWDQNPAWTPGSYARVTEYFDYAPEVADNCAIASMTHDAVTPLAIGTYTVNWTAVDFGGNSVTEEQIVHVLDLVGPTPDLAVLPDVFAECEITTLTEPAATDNCAGLVTVTNDATYLMMQMVFMLLPDYTDESDHVKHKHKHH